MLRNRHMTIALLALAAVVACDDDDDDFTGLDGTASVRVANATGGNIDVASGTTVATADANVGFGGASSCLITHVINSDVGVSPTGTTNSFASFAPDFRGGEHYVAVAYPGFAGATEFAYIPSGAAMATGQAGLRVFNAAASAGSYDVYVSAPGAALGTASATGIAFRTVSSYIPVAASTSQVRLTTAGTQTVTINAGNLNFTAGQNAVLVIAPPATGTTTFRTFLVTGC